jgi:hypothetical protein
MFSTFPNPITSCKKPRKDTVFFLIDNNFFRPFWQRINYQYITIDKDFEKLFSGHPGYFYKSILTNQRCPYLLSDGKNVNIQRTEYKTDNLPFYYPLHPNP